jgi:ABC-type multidrug transport system fused ATPase/permease subunit
VLIDVMRTNFYFSVILHGSNSLHNNMLKGLLYTSIQFFESNPTGRILNRVSKDQQIIDEVLPITLLDGLITLLMAIGSLVLICFLNPYVLLLLIVLVPVFCLVIHFYSRSSRRLKHLESVTRSPVYALFSSSLDGLTTIRAFKAKDTFIRLFCDRIDANTCAYTIVQAASQWLSVRLSGICWLILLAVSIQIVFFRSEMDSSAAALSLMSAMNVSLWFQWAVRQLSDADILMTSVERIDEYAQLPREEDEGSHKRLVKTSPKWPTHGKIDFRYYSLRHRFNLEYVIRHINLRIESGQKIGIIGRTGMHI